jgi:hypothetical protein
MNEAARPVFLLVDEEREALDALWRALKRRLGADYQIVAETQSERGLSVLQQLRERDKPVAVIIAAQRMQHSHGIRPITGCIRVSGCCSTDGSRRPNNRACGRCVSSWSPTRRTLTDCAMSFTEMLSRFNASRRIRRGVGSYSNWLVRTEHSCQYVCISTVAFKSIRQSRRSRRRWGYEAGLTLATTT